LCVSRRDEKNIQDQQQHPNTDSKTVGHFLLQGSSPSGHVARIVLQRRDES
jgi:hypothetical protein